MLMEIPQMLHLEGKFFESPRCLLLVCKDDISSREFTIYELMKGCSVWSVRYLVNTEELMNPLPKRWSIRSTVWSIGLGEKEEDAFLVINLSGKVASTIIMPRRPSRRGHLNKAQPAFSRLGRAMALATSGRKLKQQNNNSTKHRKLPYDSTGMNFFSSRKGKHDDTDSESEREESHSSSEDEDLSSESSGGDVQADFAFFDPKPDDFHGVKVLMTTYLDNKEWALSSFVDLILEQTTLGTVIKIAGDEDNGIYGFVSALNLQRYKDHKCMTEVKEFLLKACPDKEIKDKMQSYLGPQAADVGLLVSQYVVNLPPQLLPPLYDGLFDEILWATEDEVR
ncbi:protein BCCIP [Tanacetum coccineum]